jgi:hypothetical protein
METRPHPEGVPDCNICETTDSGTSLFSQISGGLHFAATTGYYLQALRAEEKEGVEPKPDRPSLSKQTTSNQNVLVTVEAIVVTVFIALTVVALIQCAIA